MANQIVELKDKDQLLNALQQSLKKIQTANEVLEQRVSFVYGSLSAESSVTHQRIREVIEQQDGVVASK